ncbi:DsrE family protein [Chitinophaga sp. sic0106]|uniref:DsrE family protein n=1 Tax=Chitinophaga sp. sic0106 TaxID=2854785 RepID=UPI001C471BDB|nr:DsrE family protein [Chitinophaga sp. sic0106]MBV7530596.1 DsrE family protein [Chitinophaga sp. sic0106]
MQVVFQITTAGEDMHKAMLGQIRNLLTYAAGKGQAVRVEVIVHGGAWPLLMHDSPSANAVAVLAQDKVAWLICRNTMNSQHVTESELLPFVEIVPAGVGHLVERQMEGWAYIRC